MLRFDKAVYPSFLLKYNIHLFFFFFYLRDWVIVCKDHIFSQETFVLMKISFVFFFRRRLQEVFKTSWSRRTYSIYSNFFRRYLQDVLIKMHNQDYSSWLYIFKTVPTGLQKVFKTSSTRLQHVLIKTNILVVIIRLQTSSRRLQYVLQKRLQDFFKTSSRRFEDVFKIS